MNGAQLHLLLSHGPLFAVVFGTAALLTALLLRSAELNGFALGLFVFAGVTGLMSLVSGDSAAKIIEELPRVSHVLIHRHEAAARLTQWMISLLAASSLLVAWFTRRRPQWVRVGQWTLFGLSLISIAFLARTAQLGSEIFHPELRDQNTPLDIGDSNGGGPDEDSESSPAPDNPPIENPDSI